jgi:predicted enzyme related to lactoylglutathione lyase
MVSTDSEGAGIPGGIAQSPDGSPRVTFYILVPDIDAHLARITAAGGEVVMPRTDFGVVITALAKDPQGNVIGLTEESLPSPH